MESKNLSVKEKMLVAAILKDYYGKLDVRVQNEITTALRFPVVAIHMRNDLIKVKNWVYLETACMELTEDMIELSVISNFAWKELSSEKKNEFIQKIKIFLLNEDAVVIDKKSLIKLFSDLIWYGIFNNLNS